MEAIAEVLGKWQTLIGAFLGGVFALTTAFVVAGTALRREQRVAARLLLVDLMSIVAAAQNLKTIAEEEKIDDAHYPSWVCQKLIWRRPQLSADFDANIARVNDADVSLAVHLSFVKMIYSGLQVHLARVENDRQILQGTRLRSVPRSPGATAADEREVARGLALSAEHAECAIYLLDKLVLTSVPRWAKRMRMAISPVAIEKRSRQLIQSGK